MYDVKSNTKHGKNRSGHDQQASGIEQHPAKIVRDFLFGETGKYLLLMHGASYKMLLRLKQYLILTKVNFKLYRIVFTRTLLFCEKSGNFCSSR